MDLMVATKAYISRMMEQTTGVKVLLLDSETTPIISMASTTSALLSHEVYLTDRLDNLARERMPHLKCICFLRPTPESLRALEEELRNPRYSGYWIYFSNVLRKSAIERLAEADEGELVREIQEYFADYSPITSTHFTLNCIPSPLSPYVSSTKFRLYGETPSSFDTNVETGSLQRHVDGVVALLLSLKKKPIIRYERMSNMARKLGQEVQYVMSSEPALFDFRPSATQPVLLILDRRNDPVTPLLTQWTYQAMVHELLGITNGRVDMSNAPDIKDELREVVISPEQDSFFAKNLYENFGDLGAHVKAYVGEYQAKSFSTSAEGSGTSTPNAGARNRIETIADMKKFVEEYPEFRKLGGNVSKHVALIGELSRLVGIKKLLEVSELEQSLASAENHRDDLRNLQMTIQSPEVAAENKLRLTILYALRYQKYSANAIPQTIDLLMNNGVSESDAALVHVMLNFAGADQRQDDLFMNENFFSRGKSAMKGLKGVENVYTQHTPHLIQTVELLLRSRLRDTSYPFLDPPPQGAVHPRPQDIILFMIGGTTYEEARAVEILNQRFASGENVFGLNLPGPSTTSVSPSHTRIILGGTELKAKSRFLDLLRDAATRFPATMTSSSLSLRPPVPPSQPSQERYNLQLGNISLSVGPPVDLNKLATNPTLNRAGNTLEAGVDGAATLARNVFGLIKNRQASGKVTARLVSVLVLSPSTQSERQLSTGMTIGELKVKLAAITGIQAASQALVLHAPSGASSSYEVVEGPTLAALDNDERTLAEYGVAQDGFIVKVTADSATSSALYNYVEDPRVEKFGLTKEQYAQRRDTVMAYKARNKIGRFAVSAAAVPATIPQAGLVIGARVRVDLSSTGIYRRVGTVRYMGEAGFAEGIWIGIEYDEPVGKNDGSVAGQRYFSCRLPYGGFVRPEKCEMGEWTEEDEDLKLDSDEELET
ncbi:MAG: vacuolar protein sorting-associated protein 45 [Cyphobasidiales sp. Tagirdzhanova-0007]|nr:MAG: vacuolar protein sorting-associated protein 45 [Cyphobasidiales sp. Tagirdzhanova-0007]